MINSAKSAAKDVAKFIPTQAEGIVKRAFAFEKDKTLRISVELANVSFVGFNASGDEVEQSYFTIAPNDLLNQLAEFDDVCLFWQSKVKGVPNVELFPLILTKGTLNIERVLKVAGEERNTKGDTFDRDTYITRVLGFEMATKAPFLQREIVEIIKTFPSLNVEQSKEEKDEENLF